MRTRRTTTCALGVLAAAVTVVAGTTTSSARTVAPSDPWVLAATLHSPGPAHLVGEPVGSSQLRARGLAKDPAQCANLYADAGGHDGGTQHMGIGCTHGVDVFVGGGTARTVANPQGFAVTTPPGIPCYSSGPYVKVFYAYGKGRPNRIAAKTPLIREAVAIADQIYQRSAARAGATRHVRWAMSKCHLTITGFSTARAPYDVFGLRRLLQDKHLLSHKQKALIFADSAGFGCQGIGELMPDTRMSKAANRNNISAMAAAVQGGCFGGLLTAQEAGGMVAAHELGHTLGAVQSHAPYSNNNGHCVDEWDIMCYDDGSHHKLVYRCGSAKLPQGDNAYDRLLDCGLNTYFNPKPKRGTYLAKHWNIANSSWLSTGTPKTWDRLTRPRISVIGPAPGTVGGVFTISVRADASVKQVSFSVNGTGVGTDSTGTARPDGGLDFSVALDTRRDESGFGGYANGTVLTIAAVGRDAYARPGNAAAVAVTVSNPTVALTSPTPYASVPWITPWSATAAGGPGRPAVSVALIVRRNGTSVVTAAIDNDPSDGFGGTADLNPFASDSSIEVAAQVTDSGGTTVASRWVPVQLPAPAFADVHVPFQVPAGHQVPMFANVTPVSGSTVTSVEFWADGVQFGVASAAPYVAYLPATLATVGDHMVEVWTNESNGRRTESGNQMLTVTPDTTLRVSGITDGSTVTGTRAVTATWTLAPGMDPATAYVSFSIGDAFDYDFDGPPWSGMIDTSQTQPGLAFVQAFGQASSPDGNTTQYDASPALLVTVN